MVWNYHERSDDIELAMWLSAFVASLDEPDWAINFARLWPTLNPLGTRYDPRNATSEAPRVKRITWNAGDLFLIQGVKRNDTALGLLNAWGDPGEINNQEAVNAQVWRANREIWQAYNLQTDPPHGPVLIAGHSFGGAVAISLAQSFRYMSATRSIRVVTFGSPRPGPNIYANLVRRIDHRRYWNHDDPVPMCPPHGSEGRTGHVFLSRDVSRRWNQTAQTGMGVMLPEDGRAVESDYPATPPVNNTTNLIRWATGIMTTAENGHAIREYYIRLVRAKELGIRFSPRPTGAPHRPTSVPPPPPPTPRTAPPEIAAERQAIITATATMRASPMPHEFEAHNLYGAWCVYRGEEAITTCATRADARRIAAMGNRLLASARARGAVDDVAINYAVASML